MAKRRGKGEGGIEKLPSGSWRGVVCRVVGGKRVRQSKTFEAKADLLAWMRRQSESGPSPAGMLGEWLTAWLKLHKTRVEPKTYETDRWAVEKYLRPLGAVKLRALTPTQIETHVRGLPASSNEQHKAARTLRNALNAAVAAGLIQSSPMSGKRVRMPKRKVKEAEALTESELAKLISHADGTAYGFVFRLWADTGMRPAEMLGLRWGDFDQANGTIRIERAVCSITGRMKDTKTSKSRRTLTLAPSTVAVLSVARGDDGEPLVPNGLGGHWWPNNFGKRVFRPLVKSAGVKCAPYTIRHTTATLLLRSGVNLKVASERLGHEDVTMTLKTYQHVMPDDQKKAAGAMESLLPTPSPRPVSKS